jgi:RNA-binding protein 5/10
LFYDGNNALWYYYNQETQQYVPYVDTESGVASKEAEKRAVDGATTEEGEVRAVETTGEEKKPSLAEAFQAAAMAAQAAAKRDKERQKEKEKETRQALKGSLQASKKKLLNLWKLRQNEGQGNPVMPASVAATNVVSLHEHQRHESLSQSATAALSAHVIKKAELRELDGGYSATIDAKAADESHRSTEKHGSAKQANNTGPKTVAQIPAVVEATASGASASTSKSDASAAVGSTPSGAKRRFTETPQPAYRDRAAERRNLYGSSTTTPLDALLEAENKDKGQLGKCANLVSPPTRLS